MTLGCATAAQGARMGMQFVVWLMRMDDRFFNIVGTDVHHMGFLVIYPNEGVVVGHDRLLYFYKPINTCWPAQSACAFFHALIESRLD
jgi:hypothetical protein